MSTSTVTALLELSDTLTFERYPVVSALVAELYDSSNVEIDRQISSLGRRSRFIRWFRSTMSVVQRWLEKARTRVGDSTCGACFRDWITGTYENGSDLSICFGESVKKYAVLRSMREHDISMNTFSGSRETNKNRGALGHFVKRNVYLEMTGALARLEHTVGSTEPESNFLYCRQQNWSRENNWSGAWRTNQGRDAYESIDGDGDTAQDTHSWSDHEERDGFEVRMQKRQRESTFFLIDNLLKISFRT